MLFLGPLPRAAFLGSTLEENTGGGEPSGEHSGEPQGQNRFCDTTEAFGRKLKPRSLLSSCHDLVMIEVHADIAGTST